MAARARTVLALVAAGAVGLAAAVAALRGADPAAAPPARAASADGAPAETARADAPLLAPGADVPELPAGVLTGTLVVASACRIIELDLATLVRRDVQDACWVTASPTRRYVLTASGPRQATGDFAPPELRLRDASTGAVLRRPGACADLPVPAVDGAGTVYTCDERRRPVAIARDGARRPIPAAEAVLPGWDDALLAGGGRVRDLDGRDVLPAPPAGVLYARALDGTVAVVTAPADGSSRLVAYRGGARVVDRPIAAAGQPATGGFALAVGASAAWLPLASGPAGTVSTDDPSRPADVLASWPATFAPDDRWAAVVRGQDVLVASLDPAQPRYRLRFDDVVGSLAWLPASR